VAVLENRAVQALRSTANWIQFAKFGVVGALGYAINLGVYALLLGIGPHEAAAVSFVVAATSNYWWNRHWTFAETRGHFGTQGARFFGVSLAAFAVNQLWLLVFLDWLGLGKIVAQAIAILLVIPLNFLGNKLWSFKR
jgi:putative flippase GtrA